MQVKYVSSFLLLSLIGLCKSQEPAQKPQTDATPNQESAPIENPKDGSGRSVQEYFFPNNQPYGPQVVEKQGFGYIPPQVSMYPQLPTQGFQYPYPGAYPNYPYGGGYFPTYGGYPQKAYGPNYLQYYDNYYGGGRPHYKK